CCYYFAVISIVSWLPPCFTGQYYIVCSILLSTPDSQCRQCLPAFQNMFLDTLLSPRLQFHLNIFSIVSFVFTSCCIICCCLNFELCYQPEVLFFVHRLHSRS